MPDDIYDKYISGEEKKIGAPEATAMVTIQIQHREKKEFK